jgi:starvation-inducible DNA-binding protein
VKYETVPGMDDRQASEVIDILQGRVFALIDLQLTLKHIHWNVVGPTFIGIHEMLDTQVGPVREMTDDAAERIAILGGQPQGTPGALVEGRSWPDYPLGTASVEDHLVELDKAYGGVIEDHRAAMASTEDLDPVTQDMLIEQLAQLEMFQWFVRAHLRDGSPASGGRAARGAATRESAIRDANAAHTAGRGPTPSEEAAAERAARSAPDVSEPYREYTSAAARTKGEGRI